MDVAGSSFFVLGSYKKKFAEIKSGTRAKGIDQLMVRLGIFWAASRVLLAGENPAVKISLHGNLYPSDSKQSQITSTDMEESSTRCSLRMPLDLVTLVIRQP